MQEKIDQLHQRRASLAAAGGEQRVAKQHEQGKLTARERIEELLDEHSFQESAVYAVHRQALTAYPAGTEHHEPAPGWRCKQTDATTD